MHTDESPAPGEVANDEKSHTAAATPMRKTSSGILLERGIATVGVARLASALAVDVETLERIVSEGRVMSLDQQRVLALAILTLSEDHPALRRRAFALLGQVRASEEFALGVTERHLNPPRLPWA